VIDGQALVNRQASARRGRKPLDTPRPRVQVTLDVETFDAYDGVARERGVALARVIREALQRRRHFLTQTMRARS
jgi:hypothetical protein